MEQRTCFMFSATKGQKKHFGRQMSKDLGQNDNYIANIENNISGPSLPMLVKICKYFDISIDESLDIEQSIRLFCMRP